jgi:hypothetical protein
MRAYPSKQDIHHPLQSFLLLTTKRVQIVCGVFEQRQVLRRLDGENERLWSLHDPRHRVDIEVCEFAEEHFVFAVVTFREPEAAVPELHPSL